MTFWTKMLTFVILFLSIVFAAMSTVIFAKREDFRGQVNVLQKKYDDTTSKLDADFKKSQGDLKEANKFIDDAKATISSLKDVTARQDDELKMARADVTAQKSVNESQLEAVKGLTSQTNILVAANNNLTTDKNNLLESNLKLTKDVSDERNRANKLEQDNASLRNDLETTTAKLGKAQETLALHDEIFEELSRRNVAWQQLIAPWIAQPDIKAKVTLVDKDGTTLIINAGTKAGVLKNYSFTIWRDGNFVAKVTVFDVRDNQSAARIVTSKLPVQRGDNAWTRMQ